MKISIVTPSYNQAQFLEETIRSVIDQGYSELEYVIIDGGSADGSQEIIRKYQDYLHYWVSEPDKGHGDALNKGFEKTTGEIMAWINSDDKYMPWTFNAVAEIFSSLPHVNWIVGTNGWWDPEGRLTHAAIVHKNIYDFLLGRFDWIQQESVFWRRSLWESSGATINSSYDLMVDGELWCKFFLKDDLYHVRCVLGGYRSHDKNRAKENYRSCLEEMQKAISEMRKECDDVLLRDMQIIGALQHLKRFIGSARANAIYRRLFSGLYERTHYRTIHFDGVSWKEGRANFALF